MDIKYNKMKESCNMVSDAFKYIAPYVVPDISTIEINNLIEKFIFEHGGYPAPLDKGFPYSTCISVNNVVCHGLPSNYILKSGDLVSIDISIRYNGYYGDSCVSFPIGELTPRRHKLYQASHEALWNSIKILRDGVYTDNIGFESSQTAFKYEFDVIRDFAGHSIGTDLHRSPNIPFYSKSKNSSTKLKSGDFITIEPMLVEYKHNIYIHKDKWSAITKDNGYGSQFEHTIYITDNGYEVLTYNGLLLDSLYNQHN